MTEHDSDKNLPVPYRAPIDTSSAFTHAANDNRFEPGQAALSRPLFNGNNPSGWAEDFRVCSWPSWSATEGYRYHVGFLRERWPSGTQTAMGIEPNADLWSYRSFALPAEAETLRKSLALNYVFGKIVSDLLPDAVKVCSNAAHIPFRTPAHWLPRNTGPRPVSGVK